MLYQTQERAMAPGIVKVWPAVIPHPTDPNGRLVAAPEIEAELADLRAEKALRDAGLYMATCEECGTIISCKDEFWSDSEGVYLCGEHMPKEGEA